MRLLRALLEDCFVDRSVVRVRHLPDVGTYAQPFAGVPVAGMSLNFCVFVRLRG